ncbi:hypothetical protein GP486_003918 [Trichoglossum hirsutum]|uniref:Uncharacterized protein n=1 Tax=Trichoglossum hirsutum TaxID=265104 RepID=A0A9P8LC08_9PEZI|nr:hypothetical protein GP486_003918 [Trichoglossum hirsutum]
MRLALRQCLSCGMAQHLAAYISKQIRVRSLAGKGSYRSQRQQRMRKRLAPLILTLFQFFERYQHRLLAETYEGNKISYQDADQPILIQQEIMESYNPALLVRVSQTYHLLLYLLRRRLAPPSRSFSLARTRSGRSLTRLAEDSVVKLLIIGGLSQVQRILSIKNRSRRRKALEKWIAGLQPQENSGVVEGVSAEPQPNRHSAAVAVGGGGGREESRNSGKALEHGRTPSSSSSSSSSPPSGLPMPRPSAAAIARLIPVLPPLGAVWVPSARELVLAKGLDATDVGVWELFIDELTSGNDSEEGEFEYLEDSGDEDPDDSGEEGEEMMELDGQTLTE